MHLAIREALVNALVHADLQGNSGIRVIKQRSGFDFINPGLLLITPKQLWQGGHSVPRNQTLLHLFSLLRLGEKEGSGGPTMWQVWREQHWRAPRILEVVEHNTTHLQLATESLLPDHAVAALVVRFGEAFTSQDELGRTVLVTAEAEGSTTHARIRELSDAHPHDITTKLAELVRLRLLDSEGKTRATVYRPRLAAPLPLFQTTPTRANAPTSAPNATTSDPNATSSGASATTLGTNATTSPAPDLPLREKGRPALEQLRTRQRAPRHIVDAAILEVCRGHHLTPQQIAQAIGRHYDTVRGRYLPDLVAAGKLEPLHPNAKHHPSQAYQTREESSP